MKKLLAVLWLCSLSTTARAQGCDPEPTALRYLDTIGIVTDDAALEPILFDAVNEWRRCPGSGGDFPLLLAQQQARRTVRVERRDGNPKNVCGTFTANSIVLYDHASEGGDRLPCGSLTLNLVHEIGHVLGLPDLDAARCHEPSIMNGITDGNGFDRSVTSRDCRAVGRLYLVPSERVLAKRLGFLDDEGPDLPPLRLSRILEEHYAVLHGGHRLRSLDTVDSDGLVWSEL